jgi:membrane dipeptidase
LKTLLALAALSVSPEAREVHRRAYVFDAHVHVINRQFHDGSDIGQRLEGGQADIPRMIEGGLDAAMFSVYVPEQYYPERYETKHALRLIELALEQIEKNRDKVELARNARDLERIRRSGKLAAVLDLEGGFDLDGDPRILRAFHRLGLRMFQLPAHNWANEFAESCCAPSKFSGLTGRGREIVRLANDLGMLINVSHASEATIEQVLAVSRHPVLATHHGMRRRNDIPRNSSDRILKAIAAKGGVIGFHIGNEFHNRPMFEWRTKRSGRPFWDTSEIQRAGERPSIADIDRRVARSFPMMGMSGVPDELIFSPEQWIEVIEEAISIVGEDHVMLGSDFDGGPTPPRGMKDIADLPMLTEAMLKRGWSRSRIEKFLGGNLLRVFRTVTENQR